VSEGAKLWEEIKDKVEVKDKGGKKKAEG